MPIHTMQSSTFDALRRQTWPSPVDAHRQLWGPVETLRQTAVCLLVGCLTSQQHASVSQGRICSDNFTCSHTEIEVADQTFYLTQSQYTDTWPTSPSADPITPGAWQGSPLECQFLSHWYDSTPKKSGIRTRDLPLSRRTPYH